MVVAVLAGCDSYVCLLCFRFPTVFLAYCMAYYFDFSTLFAISPFFFSRTPTSLSLLSCSTLMASSTSSAAFCPISALLFSASSLYSSSLGFSSTSSASLSAHTIFLYSLLPLATASSTGTCSSCAYFLSCLLGYSTYSIVNLLC